jgi:hypothetical protein
MPELVRIEDVTQALTLLREAGWGNTPPVLLDLARARSAAEIDFHSERAGSLAGTWMVALHGVKTSRAELMAACGALLIERGRRFWPSVSEVADAVRKVRLEGHRRELAAVSGAMALPTPDERWPMEDERRVRILRARLETSGVEAAQRFLRVLSGMGADVELEAQVLADWLAERDAAEMAERAAEA